MAFSKNFPRTIKGSAYPQWEEMFLTEQEEAEQEKKARAENILVFKECIEDAAHLMKEKSLGNYQSNLVQIAVALFEKRASHTIYWKESAAKEKFDRLFPK